MQIENMREEIKIAAKKELTEDELGQVAGGEATFAEGRDTFHYCCCPSVTDNEFFKSCYRGESVCTEYITNNPYVQNTPTYCSNCLYHGSSRHI